MVEDVESDSGKRKQEKYQKYPVYQDNMYIFGEQPVSHQPAESNDSFNKKPHQTIMPDTGA